MTADDFLAPLGPVTIGVPRGADGEARAPSGDAPLNYLHITVDLRELLAACNAEADPAPGLLLAHVLDILDMTQRELARRARLSPKHVNQLVAGHAALSYNVALRLECVTGIPALWWSVVEAAYRIRLLRNEPSTDTDGHAPVIL